MRLLTSLFLLHTTLTFAIPSPQRAHIDLLFVGHTSKISGTTVRQSGLNFSPCTNDSSCVGDRICVTRSDDGVAPCTIDCVCLPPIINPSTVSCTTSADCDAGESCFLVEESMLCVANEIIASVIGGSPGDDEASAATVPPSTTEVANSMELTTDDSDSDTGDEESTTTNNPILGGVRIGSSDNESTDGEPEKNEESSEGEGETANGLTLDPCQDSDGCAGSRTCRNFSGGGRCSDSDDCRCFPAIPVRCEDDSACDEGEGCFGLQDVIGIRVPFLSDEFNEFNFCISRVARDDAICIASHSLAHISREHLVFEKDAVAHVLCDVNDSCATPGHMVQFKGEGMMMKSYCELTRCVRKLMKVNSPKYRRGITVPSHTEELVFTGLAARFQSRAEEGVLSVAVRFGF